MDFRNQTLGRTSRNFDGIVPPGKKIKDLLPELLGEISKKSDNPWQEIFQAWKALLGEQMASWTEPVSFIEGVLTVKVKNATLYSLLCQHEKPRLLKQLQKKFPIRKLLFRVG